MSLALGDIPVKILLYWMSEIFLPMFSSRMFMVLWLIFKCFIHLEFIFAYGVSWRLSFIFLHVAVQISQLHLSKRIFTPFYASAHFVEYELTTETWVYFWVLCSVPLIYMSVPMPAPGCFDYSGLVIQFDIRYCDPSYFVLLSQNCCSYLGSFMVPYKFMKCLLYICEICHLYINRDCITVKIF